MKTISWNITVNGKKYRRGPGEWRSKEAAKREAAAWRKGGIYNAVVREKKFTNGVFYVLYVRRTGKE